MQNITISSFCFFLSSRQEDLNHSLSNVFSSISSYLSNIPGSLQDYWHKLKFIKLNVKQDVLICKYAVNKFVYISRCLPNVFDCQLHVWLPIKWSFKCLKMKTTETCLVRQKAPEPQFRQWNEHWMYLPVLMHHPFKSDITRFDEDCRAITINLMILVTDIPPNLNKFQHINIPPRNWYALWLSINNPGTWL